MSYRAILTNVGAAKQAAAMSGATQVGIASVAIGDGGGQEVEPHAPQTALVNQVFSGPAARVVADGNQILVEQVIPPNIGGFWMREAGIFDINGDMIAVANLPERFKPLLIDGAGVTSIIRLTFNVTSGGAFVQVVVDPSAQLMTVDALFDGLETKADVDHGHESSDISDSTTIGRAVLVAADQAAARLAIGAASQEEAIALAIAVS